MSRQGLLSDSGYQEDHGQQDFQRFIPSPSVSVGKHQIQNGRITSHFNVPPSEMPGFDECLDKRRRFSCKKCMTRVSLYCKISSSCKLVTIACCLVVISVSLACYVRLSILMDQPGLELSVGDQVCVTPFPISSTFCRSIEMHSEQNFTAYRLAHEPKRHETLKREYRGKSPTLWITGEDFYESHYRIIAGSTMDVYISIDLSVVEFYVIAGDKNWGKWKSNPHCESCFHLFRPLGFGKKDDCAFESCHIRVNFPHTDKYYLVLYNPLRPSYISDAVVNMECVMNRTMYAITTSLDNCTLVTSCTMPLGVFTRQSVMVEHEVTCNTSEYFENIVLSVHCVPRHYMYVVAFVVTPFLIWMIAFMVVHLHHSFTYDKPQDEELRALQTDSHSSRSRSYGSFSSDGYSIPDELLNHI